MPGLLAAGVGSLIFVGLDSWTGFGTFSLAVPNIPSFGSPDGPEFLWAVGIGVVAAVIGAVIRRVGLYLQPIVESRMVALTPVVGLAVAVSGQFPGSPVTLDYQLRLRNGKISCLTIE